MEMKKQEVDQISAKLSNIKWEGICADSKGFSDSAEREPTLP
jgi:hypothetical protein